MNFSFCEDSDPVTVWLTAKEGELSSATLTEFLSHGTCGSCHQQLQRVGGCKCGGSGVMTVPSERWPSLYKLIQKDIARINSRRARETRRFRMQECAGFHNVDDIETISRLQEGRCYFCDMAFELGGRQVDHLLPVAQRGSEWPSNLALLCRRCNSSKNDGDERHFWSRLEKSHGLAWVADRKAAIAPQRKAKQALTRLRKKELATKAFRLQQLLIGALEQLAPTRAFQVQVVTDDAGIRISAGLITVSAGPYSHRRLDDWQDPNQVAALAQSLLGVSEVIGNRSSTT